METPTSTNILTPERFPTIPRSSIELPLLIDAYQRYSEFISNFRLLEEGNLLPILAEGSPWQAIANTVARNRADVGRVLSKLSDAHPEDIGKAVFEAKDKRKKVKPKGAVQAFQRGACLVVVVDSEEDMRVLCNIEDPRVSTYEGVFLNTTYTVGKGEWGGRIAEVPTIIVRTLQGSETENTIRHEENHYRLGIYLDALVMERKVQNFDMLLAARNAIAAYTGGTEHKKLLIECLRRYATELQHQAIIEYSAESFASGAIDTREPYTDRFDAVLRYANSTPHDVLDIVDGVRREYRKDVLLHHRMASQIIREFTRIEPDRDIVYGTVMMRLLLADPTTIDSTLQSMEFIRPLSSGQEAFDIQRDLQQILETPTHGEGAERIMTEAGHQKEINTELAEVAQSTKGFGYMQARAQGIEFPEAITQAVLAREQYLSGVLPIRIKVLELQADLAELAQQRESRRKTVDTQQKHDPGNNSRTGPRLWLERLLQGKK